MYNRENVFPVVETVSETRPRLTIPNLLGIYNKSGNCVFKKNPDEYFTQIFIHFVTIKNISIGIMF